MPHYAPATGVFSATWVIVALPMLGAAILLLSGRRTDRYAHILGCALPAASFLLVLIETVTLLTRSGNRQIDNFLFSWVPVASFHANASLLFDPLSATFALIISGVGSLICVYSVGYMAHDPDRRRFFGQINFFISAMLLLVLADNYLLMYVGWEGVGLASYLLIGFWYFKPEAAVAAKKAFIVNRVGDVGLSLAIMFMFATFGTFAFAGTFGAAAHANQSTLVAITLLLLLAACGKSAQFPLHTWLADAMEGPTPVSALIHAATMVTAGVYLVARSGPIYDHTATGRELVAVAGVVTILIGGVIGCAIDDIKRVLAYSTISQIGYMFLGVGLGRAGYALGVFHFMTHAFFKANLFMGAGSVMHATGDNVDMRRYGGLLKRMPITGWAFIAGYLAIIGLPPFAGFFSKDAIIEAAFDNHHYVLGACAIAGAGLTSYYMTRLVAMTFFGQPRYDEREVHPHDPDRTMWVPMVVLAFFSVVAGFGLKINSSLTNWLKPSVGPAKETSLHAISPWVLIAITLIVVVAAGVEAYFRYGRRPVPVTPPTAVTPVTVAARQRLYFDHINETVFMRPGQYLARALVFFDGRGVDGVVNGVAALMGGTSSRTRRWQTGFVRSYALSMVGGAVILVAALLYMRGA